LEVATLVADLGDMGTLTASIAAIVTAAKGGAAACESALLVNNAASVGDLSKTVRCLRSRVRTPSSRYERKSRDGGGATRAAYRQFVGAMPTPSSLVASSLIAARIGGCLPRR
jgi:hypothetical protein